VPVDDRLRRPEPGVVYPAAGADQHPVAGTGHAQRPGVRGGGAGPRPQDGRSEGDDRRQAGGRVPAVRRPAAVGEGVGRAGKAVREGEGEVRRRPGEGGEDGDRPARPGPEGGRRDRPRRLDGGGKRAPEPRRDVPEAVTFMTPRLTQIQHQTRRHFLTTGSLGLAAAALALLAEDGRAAEDRGGKPPGSQDPLAPKKPHFTPKAKRVIYLHMSGSPPHLDLFDYKPELVKRTGQDCPESLIKGKRFAFTSGTPKLLGTPRKFKQYGRGGIWMS